MYWHDGWNWLWMSLAMLGWAVLIAAAVYAGVRLAQRDHRGTGP